MLLLDRLHRHALSRLTCEVAALDASLGVGGLPLRLGGRALRVERYLLPLPVERGLLLGSPRPLCIARRVKGVS